MTGKLESYFTARYADASIEVQRKAAILWKIDLIVAAACLVAGVLINIVVVPNFHTASVEIVMSCCMVLSLSLLRRGGYYRASTLAILTPLFGLTLTGIGGYSGDRAVDFTLLGYNLIAVLFLSCLVGYRLLQPVLATVYCLAAVVAGYIVMFTGGEDAAQALAAIPLLINSLLLVMVSGAVALFVMRINRDIVRVAEEEARRHREKAGELQRAEERLLVTLRSIGDGVIATGTDGGILLMNGVAEELSGWPQGEAVNRPLGEVLRLVDELTREPCACPVEKVLATGRITSCGERVLLVARDGTERAIADSAAPIRDREGGIVGVVLVLRDVTEKLRLEERLRNAQKLESLGILAGGIAHDFNNLLVGIFGYIELALGDARRAAPAAAENLERALSVFGRAASLTRQLLTFSRGGQPVKRLTDLGPLLREGTEFVLAGSSVRPRFDIAADLWPCEADATQLAQVVDNLVLNARQAMPSGGTVTVAACNVPEGLTPAAGLPPGDYVRITVSDEGAGISRRHLASVFDPFFTTKQEGSGLGLTIVHSIVRKHDGAVDVASEPGKGATFTIHLPAVRREAAPAETNVPPETDGIGGTRVLVLDDEDFMRDIARALLAGMGAGAQCAADGTKAVALARAAAAAGAPFEVALLDLTIPGGRGGVEIAKDLRGIDPCIRTIATSGYSNDPVMAEPGAHGFDGRLVKPYRRDDLREALLAVLRNPPK